MLAQKIVDDICLKNSDFLSIFPFFSLEEMNCLESIFLETFHFDMRVTLQTYA